MAYPRLPSSLPQWQWSNGPKSSRSSEVSEPVLYPVHHPRWSNVILNNGTTGKQDSLLSNPNQVFIGGVASYYQQIIPQLVDFGLLVNLLIGVFKQKWLFHIDISLMVHLAMLMINVASICACPQMVVPANHPQSWSFHKWETAGYGGLHHKFVQPHINFGSINS